MEHLAIFLVCVGVFGLIWTTVRHDKKGDRRGPGK